MVTSHHHPLLTSQRPHAHLQWPSNDKKEEILISRQIVRPSCYPSEVPRLPEEASRGRLHSGQENEFKGNVMGIHKMVEMCKEV